MIVVSIDLISARTGKGTTIGRMIIANDETGDGHKNNYNAWIARRNLVNEQPEAMIDKSDRTGRVESYPSTAYSVWRLVMRALRSCFPEERGGRA